jgi:hypothetical protein
MIITSEREIMLLDTTYVFHPHSLQYVHLRDGVCLFWVPFT